jgi:hypothetical protein
MARAGASGKTGPVVRGGRGERERERGRERGRERERERERERRRERERERERKREGGRGLQAETFPFFVVFIGRKGFKYR